MSHELRTSIRSGAYLALICAGIILLFLFDEGSNKGLILFWVAAIGLPAIGALYVTERVESKGKDHLKELCGSYLECKGFCFAISTRLSDGMCVLDVHFQNRQTRPCQARIILRPTRKSFRAQDSSLVTLHVNCPAAAFGRTSMPLPVDPQLQGSVQRMDIVAGVNYPHGRGDTVHYEAAAVTLANSVSFATPFTSAIQLAALMGGVFVTHKHASLELAYPPGVKHAVATEDCVPSTEILYQPGDEARQRALEAG